MSRGRLLLTAAFVAASSLAASGLGAQGVTTGAISGTITSSEGLAGIEGAQVQVVNTSTGYTTGSISRANGLYMVQGLEVGGPYIVRVRLIGFQPAERGGVTVSLGRATPMERGSLPTPPRSPITSRKVRDGSTRGSPRTTSAVCSTSSEARRTVARVTQR